MLLMVILAIQGVVQQPDKQAVRLVELAAKARGDRGVGEVVKMAGVVKQAEVTKRALYFVSPPDRRRLEEVWMADGREAKQIVIYDGKRAWLSLNDAARECTAGELAAIEHMVERGRIQTLYGLTDNAKYALSMLPDSTVNGAACDVVRVRAHGVASLKGTESFDLFLDKSNHLLRKVEGMLIGADGKAIEYSEVYSDFKTFSERNYPTATTRRIGTLPVYEIRIDSIELIPVGQAESLFASPLK